MDNILITPKDLNEFHTAIKFFLDKVGYVPTNISQTNAIPSSTLELLKTTIPKLGRNMITLYVKEDNFTTYGEYVSSMDVIGCIAYKHHATAFKYIREENKVVYFDSHGTAPKPLLSRLFNQLFEGCSITYNTKVLQGRHGVCSLWAIWFCLLMSVSSFNIDKIKQCTLDDTYMMCLNGVLYVSINNYQTSPVKRKRTLNVVLDNCIVDAINNVSRLQTVAQQCILGSHYTNTIASILHNNNNAFSIVRNEIEGLQKDLYDKKTLSELIPIIDAKLQKITQQYYYIESESSCVANCECAYNSYSKIQWENYAKVICQMRTEFTTSLNKIKDSLKAFPQDILINQLECV